MHLAKRILGKIFAFIDKHRVLAIIIAIITTIVNAGIIVANPSNIVSGVAFAICIPGAINLVLSKTGHVFLG